MNKKLIITAVASLFLAFVLGVSGVLLALATQPSIDAKRTHEQRDITGFNKVQIETLGRVEIKKGDREGVSIDADERYVKDIKTDVRDNTLYISDEGSHRISLFSFKSSSAITYIVTVKDLEQVDMKGMGDLDIDFMDGDKIVLNFEGAGNTSIDGITAKDLSVTHKGAGYIEFNKVSTETMTLHSDGFGQISMSVTATKAGVTKSGAGDLTMEGNVDDLTVESDGVGDFHGKHLQTKNTILTWKGIGDAEISVSDNLTINKAGMGDIRYYGKPHVSTNSEGLGKIQRGGDSEE